MNDTILQILLILAYLAIGLISVTYPIYAISVHFLPAEKSETEKERRNRIVKLREKIRKLTAKLNGERHDSEMISQLQEEMKEYQNELKRTELGIRFLSAKGAVLRPIVALALALSAAGSGIYFSNEGYLHVAIIGAIFSGLFNFGAMYNLYRTISAIEYAALRPGRTVDSFIAFREEKTLSRIRQLSLGEKDILCVGVTPQDCDIEDARIFLEFPPELELVDADVGADIDIAEFAHATTIMIKEEFLPKEFETGGCFVVQPTKVGEYSVPVRVCAKGTYETGKELTVRVVEGKRREPNPK